MTRIWMYTLGASTDPNNVHCVVPWPVDEDLIYFGPCKRRLRERLRRTYLVAGRTHEVVKDDLYVVSVNGANGQRVRKLVSAGKLSDVMTFAEAAIRLDGERFAELRHHPMSPLHVRPIIESGVLMGYRHISDEHKENNEWIADLTSKQETVETEGRTIRLNSGDEASKVFDRDCCMLLDNIFFAQGEGLHFDQEAVSILKAAQPGVKGIDAYALFGLSSKGQAKGLRGRFLEISGSLADLFIAWLQDRSQSVTASCSGKREILKDPCRTRDSKRKRRIC